MSKMEEKKLLKSMIKERDKKILLLQKKHEENEEYLGGIKSQIEDIERISENDEAAHRKKVSELDTNQARTEDEMRQLEEEMQQTASLHEYAKLLKDADQSTVGTTYVLRLQSQLMKSMHAMGMLDNQMKLLKKHCNSMVKSLKDEISNGIDEKCKMEVELMNRLGELDKNMHEMEEDYTRRLEEKRATVAELEERLGCCSADEDEQDEEQASDGAGQEREGEDDAALDLLIDGLQSQLETMESEKESMEQHLRLAISEKDAVLSRLKEETRRQEEMMRSYEEKQRRGHALATLKESDLPSNNQSEEEGSSAGEEGKGRETASTMSKKCFSDDDETSDTLRSECSSGHDDR